MDYRIIAKSAAQNIRDAFTNHDIKKIRCGITIDFWEFGWGNQE
jgi:hypothetical protein